MYLVETKAQIKRLKLEKSIENYFLSQFENQDFIYTNNAGLITACVKVNKLSNGRSREKTRTQAFKVYEVFKGLIKDLQIEAEDAEHIELFAEGLGLSAYSFHKYLAKSPETKWKKASTSNKKANLKEVNTIVEATNWARDLVNEPVSYLTAEQLAKDVKAKCSEVGIKTEILKKAKIESLKMGGLLAVNKGSIDPPTFSILEWKPANAVNKKPIVLVGKGIVYDTGGLSLKPTAGSMDIMKCDMGGAAAMAGTIYGAAKLKLPLHIITLLPSTDNRPGGKAYAPGDVITMFDKTTVEILNTDAEGRMVLADALAYANKYKPELVIDAATLTGAAMRAVGKYASVMMGNANQKEMDEMTDASDYTFDRVIQFPFWEEYLEEMKSPIADLKNLGGAEAGMITAGKFLEHFTKYPYIHLDIAGPAYHRSRDNYRGQGGSGAGVRLLIEFLKRRV